MVSRNIHSDMDNAVRKADNALSELAENNSGLDDIEKSIRERNDLQVRNKSAEEKAALDLEFGRTLLPQEKADQLTSGSIIPLPGNPNGNVRIVWDKHQIAEGTLMIFEGKLAIRINELETAK
ncbi:MAG: FliM/FliN family flagellar motor switch protein [Planctomycetia bacterium]|nr:FliM/FliN family flagellar motor switch protein [Planctomycetia bacterium]